ncbi:sugar ABC transporter permease [Cellulomonas hominis]|uniref:carbohydrate ABC transporter permease n=1 Tax=Cellulomonas hominis TaxID=156981 RepID=UPI001C0F6DF5|nr:sugar ABC transporter permease [Cellulomonas hominis]MBU5422057.1 sugar ABC transporter permease [Cellulomonas hominis]
MRSVWFSFNDVSPFSGIQGFVGLDNFVEVVSDPGFGMLVRNTLAWTVGAVLLQLLLGLAGAHLLNARFPLRGVYRGLAMIPWATPSVLVALMWIWILDPNHGVLNAALQGLGILDRPFAFLSDSATALPTLIAVDVWQGVPLFAVMILAALQGVSPELREAASMDGCGPVGVFRHVVLPAILPTILITTLLRLIWTANYVDLVLIMTGGGPGTSSTTLSLESYVTAYKSMNFGGGAAYAVLQAAALSVLVVLYIRLTGKANRR